MRALDQVLRGLQTPVRYTIILLIGIAAIFAAFPALANPTPEQTMEWGVMGMQLFGGLALFLFGMEQMADALKAVAGEKMKAILAKLTTNRFLGAATGAFVTAVIQSSSVTTVLVVGFITAGLMTLSQSVGVIMGANIGTTITAQIVAFKVTKAALLMIGVGFSMLFISKQEKIKQYGAMLMGLGLVFFGMSVMSEAMKPLRSFQPFLDLMISMESPLVGILVAAAFTGLIQSSSATTAIVIVMASQGFITLPAGIALAFGANVGTCVTAMLASIGKPREAIRAAVVHVIFNVAGVLLWIAFIPYLAEWVTSISPSHPELAGAERLSAETPRQIANAHTIFNIANTFIFIWFTTHIAALAERLIPDKPEPETFVVTAKYLDDDLLQTPSLALDRVRLEVLHMGDYVQQMLNEIMPAILTGKRKALKDIAQLDDVVDILYEQIIDYLGKISKQSLTEGQMEEFLQLMEAVGELENIGDTIETNMVELGLARINSDISISKPTTSILKGFHQVVVRAVRAAVQAVAQNNGSAARNVILMKHEVDSMADSAAIHQAERLVAEEPNRIPAYTIEMDIIEKQKRIYYYAKRMAKTVVPGENLED
ncbi:MAG: Na/Pi cotransporter family protein [Sedimenticola sp.]